MKIPILFKQYIWLIETIYEAGKITFAEINEKWLRTEEEFLYFIDMQRRFGIKEHWGKY